MRERFVDLSHAVEHGVVTYRGLPAPIVCDDLSRAESRVHQAPEAYFESHPFLTRAAAALLVERGARLVGIDSLDIDDTADLARPVHTLLLGAEIPIVEHLTNLASLPREDFTFSAVPARVRAFGTFPVRAYARAPL